MAVSDHAKVRLGPPGSGARGIVPGTQVLDDGLDSGQAGGEPGQPVGEGR